MRKKILFAILPIFFLACNFLFQFPNRMKTRLPLRPKPGSANSIVHASGIDLIHRAVRHCPH